MIDVSVPGNGWSSTPERGVTVLALAIETAIEDKIMVMMVDEYIGLFLDRCRLVIMWQMHVLRRDEWAFLSTAYEN